MGKPKHLPCANCGHGHKELCQPVVLGKLSIMQAVGKYLMNIVLWLDLGLNTLTGGSPYESVSSRLGRNYRGTWIERMVDKYAWEIFRQKWHCENSTRPTKEQLKDSIFK